MTDGRGRSLATLVTPGQAADTRWCGHGRRGVYQREVPGADLELVPGLQHGLGLAGRGRLGQGHGLLGDPVGRRNLVPDAVGRPETWEQAFYARDLAGTVVLVGVPTPDMRIDMPLVDFFSRGGALKSSWYGDCLPERDFPTLIDLYLQGRLPLEKFVSERIGLDGIEEAFHKMHDGTVLRSVVML